MIEPPSFPQEDKRLASLNKLHLLDTPIEERFERITRMVCRLLDVPISIFNLLDADRQHYKSAQGLANTDAPLQAAFCTHAILESDMLLVPDAKLDTRFFDNPFVTGGLNVGFYAGCPVRADDGMPVGTLWAIDTKPRDMTPEQLTILRDLAGMVETELRASNLSKVCQSLTHELTTANHLAMVDPLTRLWNRTGITKFLDRQWSESIRQHKSITVVMADIDHFKTINDTHGHPAGDAILRGVAKRMLESLRNEDAIGRMGGEEFLIILTDTAPERAFETVDRLRQSIAERPFDMGGMDYNVTISFGGITITPEGEITPDVVIKKVDDAMYRAKKSGRNRVVWAD